MSKSTSPLDELSEYATNFLLSGEGTARQLAVHLAKSIPQRSPLELIFVLSLTAAGIEETFGGAQMALVAQDGWRVAALLGVDLHMMALHNWPSKSCADLLDYWQRADDYFLRA